MKKLILFSLLLSVFGLNTVAQSKQFLYIKFTPADATLTINGVEQETTDGVFESLMPMNKEYHCTISKAGYEVVQRDVIMFEPNRTYAIEVNLKEIPKYGSLLIQSTPSRADIYIDGQYEGKTPRYIPEILIGPHKVFVLDTEHNITIEEGKERELIVTRKEEAINSTSSEVKEETIKFLLVEEKPSFKGGDENMFSKWVNQRLVYPEVAQENGVQGRVILQFTIEKDGSVTNVNVLRGVCPELDKEAVRVVSSSPKWKPGKTGNKAVAVTYTFPVIFQLR